MAEDKKPKIDLKARLGKAGASTVPPAAGSSPSSSPPVPSPAIPVPPPVATFGSSAPQAMPGVRVPSIPPASGVPGMVPSVASSVGGAANPIAAMAGNYGRGAQRIEVDETAVEDARRGAKKQGVVFGLVASVLFAGVGYVAGGASEQSAGRAKSVADAKDLADSALKAKGDLAKIVEVLEQGRDQLKQRKFPESLARDLGGINVDFDGTKLAGRRFSGVPTATTQQLIEFVTAVQQTNDRKLVVTNLLSKLQKPLTEQLNAPAGQQNISHIVVIDKDPTGSPSAILAGLATPVPFKSANDLPAEFTFGKPGGGGNVTAPRYKGGDISAKPAAVYVAPKSFESVCPSETAGAFAQLSAQISNFVRDLKGEPAAVEGMDGKPGLVERADRLAQALSKVAP